MTYHLPKFERQTFVVIRTDGREEVLPFLDKKSGTKLAALRQALGFDTFDHVTLTRRGRAAHIVMVVNDRGYESEAVERAHGHFELVPVAARFPPNRKATDLYHAVCVPSTTHQIVGDVALMYDDD